MNFDIISDNLNEARHIAHGLKLFHSQLDDGQPMLTNMSEHLCELVDDLCRQFSKNRKSISEKLEKNIEDQFLGIEIYANMKDWQIELLESSESNMFDPTKNEDNDDGLEMEPS